MDQRFEKNIYLIRKKMFKLAGAAFHIYDEAGGLLFYSKQKAFKLKEDIRLFESEAMTEELLSIQARQVIDFSAAYDVVDSKTNEKVGALQRKGLKSILKDEWIVMDPNDREIGIISEDSMILALLRRFITPLIPQTYIVTINGREVATFKQNFNPFVLKITADFSGDVDKSLDRRLGLAAGVLLGAIEGRQN
ncbi:MAG: hypothetical protein KAI43_12680 [Candidatus Aureabacteria bacterium]|nr:hypothetical protein [Candidatus Auribacterota bacterium]